MLLYDDGLRQQCDDAVVDDEVLANMLSLSLLFSSVDANADNFSACHCVYLRYGNCVLRCGVLFCFVFGFVRCGSWTRFVVNHLVHANHGGGR